MKAVLSILLFINLILGSFGASDHESSVLSRLKDAKCSGTSSFLARFQQLFYVSNEEIGCCTGPYPELFYKIFRYFHIKVKCSLEEYLKGCRGKLKEETQSVVSKLLSEIKENATLTTITTTSSSVATKPKRLSLLKLLEGAKYLPDNKKIKRICCCFGISLDSRKMLLPIDTNIINESIEYLNQPNKFQFLLFLKAAYANSPTGLIKDRIKTIANQLLKAYRVSNPQSILGQLNLAMLFLSPQSKLTTFIQHIFYMTSKESLSETNYSIILAVEKFITTNRLEALWKFIKALDKTVLRKEVSQRLIDFEKELDQKFNTSIGSVGSQPASPVANNSIVLAQTLVSAFPQSDSNIRYILQIATQPISPIDNSAPISNLHATSAKFTAMVGGDTSTSDGSVESTDPKNLIVSDSIPIVDKNGSSKTFLLHIDNQSANAKLLSKIQEAKRIDFGKRAVYIIRCFGVEKLAKLPYTMYTELLNGTINYLNGNDLIQFGLLLKTFSQKKIDKSMVLLTRSLFQQVLKKCACLSNHSPLYYLDHAKSFGNNIKRRKYIGYVFYILSCELDTADRFLVQLIDHVEEYLETNNPSKIFPHLLSSNISSQNIDGSTADALSLFYLELARKHVELGLTSKLIPINPSTTAVPLDLSAHNANAKSIDSESVLSKDGVSVATSKPASQPAPQPASQPALQPASQAAPQAASQVGPLMICTEQIDPNFEKDLDYINPTTSSTAIANDCFTFEDDYDLLECSDLSTYFYSNGSDPIGHNIDDYFSKPTYDMSPEPQPDAAIVNQQPASEETFATNQQQLNHIHQVEDTFSYPSPLTGDELFSYPPSDLYADLMNMNSYLI